MDYREGRVLWQKASILVDQGIPAIVVGDFNCIDQVKDKRSGRPFIEDTTSGEFGNFLQSNGLVDLGFVGPHYIWYNNQFGVARVWKRIDKFFITPFWLQLHPDHLVRHMTRIASDDSPIFLSTNASV